MVMINLISMDGEWLRKYVMNTLDAVRNCYVWDVQDGGHNKVFEIPAQSNERHG